MDLKLFSLAGPQLPPIETLTELVRGNDQLLLEHYIPLVREAPISLDFISVRRVDAAGVSALLTLYTTAHKAGHRFDILNASTRVVQTLALLGLDGLLLAGIEPQAANLN
ncbi:MAG: STAS domain-containing protein [Terracidiphilus sp.]|jgi:anti-anti-sigma regulatory factor